MVAVSWSAFVVGVALVIGAVVVWINAETLAIWSPAFTRRLMPGRFGRAAESLYGRDVYRFVAGVWFALGIVLLGTGLAN